MANRSIKPRIAVKTFDSTKWSFSISINSKELASFAGHFLPLCWKSSTKSETSGNRKFSTALPKPTALRTNRAKNFFVSFKGNEKYSVSSSTRHGYILSILQKFQPNNSNRLKDSVFFIASFLRNLSIKLKISRLYKDV